MIKVIEDFQKDRKDHNGQNDHCDNCDWTFLQTSNIKHLEGRGFQDTQRSFPHSCAK